MNRLGLYAAVCALVVNVGCSTMGNHWMAQPLTDDEELKSGKTEGGKGGKGIRETQTIGQQSTQTLDEDAAGSGKTLSDDPQQMRRHATGKIEGRVIGKFRNTYYDFPSESEFSGGKVSLKNAECGAIKDVPRGFFEAVCVQGSGTLVSGQTVSFAKRDCSCADVCPRTGQKICFEALDARQFPYGRGASGQPITPLSTVAVDTSIVPLGTAIYVPELDGMPRDTEGSGFHDGCFVAQDRGLRVKGKHVDVFTGDTAMTRLWNKLVPSNKGVTVVLDSPRCEHAAASETANAGASGGGDVVTIKTDKDKTKEKSPKRSTKEKKSSSTSEKSSASDKGEKSGSADKDKAPPEKSGASEKSSEKSDSSEKPARKTGPDE